MYQILKQALKVLLANPMRTILTTLGIMIGIATVVLVLSAGAGFRSLINSQLQVYGTNTLFIETRVPPTTKNRNAGAMSADMGRAISSVAITTFKNRDLQNIKQIPNVVNAYGMVVGQKVISYRDVSKNTLFYGTSAARFQIDKSTLKYGRFFSSTEDAGEAQVAILGSTLAKDLFGNGFNPVGKIVRLGNLNFKVIGVYNPVGVLGGGSDDMLYIPLKTAQKKILGINYLLMAIVQLKNANQGAFTAHNIRLLLRQNHRINNPAKDDFLVETQAQAMGTFNTIFDGITILLIAIAAISLIVGGIGIMNIMYVVVTERTAEIGLKKALGAKNSDILTEFLVESVIITILGGVIGIIFGSLLGYLVAVIARYNNLVWIFSVPFYAMALAFGVSAVIGIGFGIFPAYSAAKLDPVEALSHE